MAEYILEMKGIVKQFPGTLALNEVSFNLKSGEVMALIGENGAGKSTLMNVLMGVHAPDRGDIFLDGKKIENKSPHEALCKGIGMVPQELNLVNDISIAENIFLGSHQKKNGLIDWGKTISGAKDVLNLLQVDINPSRKVSSVSAAYQQLVSIARTLIAGSNILILDEPTAALTHKEAAHLFDNIRQLKKSGKSIIIITHHLDEVVEISDRVSIMRDGCMVKICNTSELTADEMIYYMANVKVKKQVRVEREISKDVFMEISDFERPGEFHDVNFQVHRGEILGVAGLVGSGRTELFSCIYGLTKKHKGRVLLEGKEVEIVSPSHAISLGMGLVPEERRKQGMFPELSIYENVMLPSYDRIKKAGAINYKLAKSKTNHQIKQLRIKTPSDAVKIKSLSGGNQQKVILARWMEKKVKMLILDEPTRGIDVRAKGEIYDLIRAMAESGITIIVISSEIEELITVADRIMVMYNGEIKGTVIPDADFGREDVLRIALR